MTARRPGMPHLGKEAILIITAEEVTVVQPGFQWLEMATVKIPRAA